MIQAHFEAEPIEVLRPNLDVVRWFTEVMGLMRMSMSPSGRMLMQGADWAQIDARRRLSRRRVSPEMIEGLDVMANAYCRTLNARST